MRPASGRRSESAAEASVLLSIAPMNRTFAVSPGSQRPSSWSMPITKREISPAVIRTPAVAKRAAD